VAGPGKLVENAGKITEFIGKSWENPGTMWENHGIYRTIMGNYKSSNNIAVGSHGADDSVMATLSPKNWVKEYLIMLG
jgi:hypothetical protein